MTIQDLLGAILTIGTTSIMQSASSPKTIEEIIEDNALLYASKYLAKVSGKAPEDPGTPVLTQQPPVPPV